MENLEKKEFIEEEETIRKYIKTDKFLRSHDLWMEVNNGEQPQDFQMIYYDAYGMIRGMEELDENKLLDYLGKMKPFADEIYILFEPYDHYNLLDNKDFIVKAIQRTGGMIPFINLASTNVIKEILQDEDLMRKIFEEQIHIPNFLSGRENLAVILYQLMWHDELSQNNEFMQQLMRNLVNITGELDITSNRTLIDSIRTVIFEKCPETLRNREFFENLLNSIQYLSDCNMLINLPEEFCSDIDIIKKYLEKAGLYYGISIEILNSPEMLELTRDNINEYIIDTIADLIEKTGTVVTHFGDDLDNKASIYAIQQWAEDNDLIKIGHPLKVIRVPAGQIKDGYLNIDTGGHKGIRGKIGKTIVIDGDLEHGVKSACEALSKLEIYVPEQIVELADTSPNRVSSLDSRSALSLVRYLNGEQVFKLAEAGLLDKTLSDEQIEEFDLVEAHNKQQQIIDNAVQKIKKYTIQMPNGEKIVLAPEQILGGSAIAYEMGINYYVSTATHLDKDKNPDGITFAIASKPGTRLPEEVLDYGRELQEEYRIDRETSGIFVSPNGQMVVAGGFKNPDFRIPNETIDGILSKIKEKFIRKSNKKQKGELTMKAEMYGRLIEAEKQGKILNGDLSQELSKKIDIDREEEEYE